MIGIFIFILAIVILIAYTVLSTFSQKAQSMPSMGDTGKNILQSQTDRYIPLWDSLFGFLFIGASLAAAISAYFIDTHPIFFILTIIMLGIFIAIGAVISNAYYSVETSAAFSSFSSSFQLMHYLMNHLAHYILVEGALIVIALFTKARQ